MAKSPNPLARNVIWLNCTHSFLNLQQNFSNEIFIPILYFGKIPANYANSAQFAHIVHESCEIRTIC